MSNVYDHDESHAHKILIARRLAKLEAKSGLFAVLKALRIKSAVKTSDRYWNEYMAFLGDLTSRAY
jgi:hypothetical protein